MWFKSSFTIPALPSSVGSVGGSDVFILRGRWSGDRSNCQLDNVLRWTCPLPSRRRENFFCALRKISAKPAYIPIENLFQIGA